MLPKSPPTVVEKAWQVLIKDPKKSGLMSGLAVVMIFLWVRMASNGPASATAAFIRRSVAAITDQSSQSSKTTSSNAVLKWLAEPHRDVQRNLFAIKLDYYARATDHGNGVNWTVDPEKSTSDTTDQDKERQILLENLQNQAVKLKLQTTVMGSVATALVNGELVKAGDTIAGFTVVKIEARRLTVEQDGVTLEIEMP